MTPGSRRIVVGWLPLFTLLAIVPGAWLASANAEERKLVVLLANIPKERRDNSPLPNPAEIWDQYFDKFKNGQNGGPRVDSHAEWWEEISYGDVTVSGDVFGWVNLPWPTIPLTGDQGPADPGDPNPPAVPTGRVPHIELRGGSDYEPGMGEFFQSFRSRFRFDLDGVGGNAVGRFGNFSVGNGLFNSIFEIDNRFGGSAATDESGEQLWMPGERFRDLNGNGIYDAGVYEWGIDKNGNGRIDVQRQASSWAQLLAVNIQFPPEEDPPEGAVPEFVNWANDTEWFDSNGDGQWAAYGAVFDARYAPILNPPEPGGEQEPFFEPLMEPRTVIESFMTSAGPIPVTFFRGDWGGTEIWIDRDGNFDLDARATQDDRVRGEGNADTSRPANFWEFLIQLNDPETEDVEYYDEQWNDTHDFPEPFEDFMRRWGGSDGTHNWVEIDQAYVDANYPGDEATMEWLRSRTGNGRYDPPDNWSNFGSNGQNSTNKYQEVAAGNLVDGEEDAELQRRRQFLTPVPETYQGEQGGWSLDEFWQTQYGSEPPAWVSQIPFMRKFDPSEPRPLVPGDAAGDRLIAFRPNRGGPTHTGIDYAGNRYGNSEAQVLPAPTNTAFGMYDGPREFHDLPSSIYHSAGDGHLGEVTSPLSIDYWGDDLGTHDPNGGGGTGDQIIPAAGPLAFNVHGDQGWDAGNQFNIEYMTWRRDGLSSTDIVVEQDIDGDGEPDFTFAEYHRDINLDGMLDVGESLGDQGEVGRPDVNSYHNYGTDPDPGTPVNGNPMNMYPFNRTRAIEDVVAALDQTVDWENFLGGPGPFGNRVMGLILLPEETGPNGMFTLPASSATGFPIRTRDMVNAGAMGIERYVPIPFFDGMGITIGGMGEGGGLPADENYQIGFAGHEYGHVWEGWPDLYDYDVRAEFPVDIQNNPVARWCVMAGGGLVHPVGPLKADSGWIRPVDITRALLPAGTKTVTLRPWEFNRNQTLFMYENPLFPQERFWIWRTAEASQGELTFDRFMPGNGVIILHTDFGDNPEALPPQQRLGAGRFTYRVIQADGEQALEAGLSAGDAGDPWPGTSGATKFDRTTDPRSAWYVGSQPSGLDIVEMREFEDRTEVDIKWSPRELPTFEWIRPRPFGTPTNDPGSEGVSVDGVYNLRWLGYDQFGGTTLEFFANRSIPGEPLGFEQGIFLSSDNKAPGEVDGTTDVDISTLPDGTYTFYARLVPGVGQDNNVESPFSRPRANLNNFGDGTMEIIQVDTSISQFERWNAVCINTQPPGAETWRVTASATGEQIGLATTGSLYTSDPDVFGRTPVQFTINPGQTRNYRVGDEFIFVTTGLTPHSTAVLIQEGEVVEPEVPIAIADLEGVAVGLAPLNLVFKHENSSDPRGAALSFSWDFGDGTPAFETEQLDRPVMHTYEQAGNYTATLTVRNAFGLTAQDQIQIRVNDALPPTLRSQAAPTGGASPLLVDFNAELTTDPNTGTQGLDFVWDFGDGTPPALTPRVQHLYEDPGVYVARVTVTNRPFNKSASRVFEIRVAGTTADDLPPEAIIEVDRTVGMSPLSVIFTGTSSSDPENGALSFTWDFGDNSPIVRGANVVEHVYTRVGDFNATLIVEDPSGQRDTATIAISVIGDTSVNNQSPVAKIAVSSTQGPAPFTVRFDASDSRDPEGGNLAYAWDFGDGSDQAIGAVVEHTYTKPRDYNVVLVVSDSGGKTGATTVRITVTSPVDTSQPNQNTPGDDVAPTTIAPTCGAGCGPVGLMPLALTLIGMGGLRRAARRSLLG